MPNVGDTVELSRDVYRHLHAKDDEEHERFEELRMAYCRDVELDRHTCMPPCFAKHLYAKAGERGVVSDVYAMRDRFDNHFVEVRMGSGKTQVFSSEIRGASGWCAKG
jgi:hypothetical protein